MRIPLSGEDSCWGRRVSGAQAEPRMPSERIWTLYRDGGVTDKGNGGDLHFRKTILVSCQRVD